MVRNNTMLVALCAIITLVMISSINVRSENLTPQALYNGIDENGVFTVENGDVFIDDAVFPPDAEALNEDALDAGIYTLLFPEGVSVTFEGSLTILEDEGAIGCIQVLGEADAMVTMDEVANDWDGIRILTDPSDDLEEIWEDRMSGGNYISFCEFNNVDEDGAQNFEAGVILVGSVAVEDAQVYVRNCLFDIQGNYTAFTAWHGGLYWFRSNMVVGTPNWAGVDCRGPLDEDDPDFLDFVISNNYIFSVAHRPIYVAVDVLLNGWNGSIANNILVQDEGGEPMITCIGSADARIVNNTLFGNGAMAGIEVNGVWCAEVCNNILVNLEDGVDGTNNAVGLVDFCLFDNIDDDEYEGGAAEGEGCVEDTDPDFVDDDAPGFDFHLLYTSPAINTGNDEVFDPDESRSDIGAFGGPLADDFSIDGYEDYCEIPNGAELADPGVGSRPAGTLGMGQALCSRCCSENKN
jgi:hypothetical protein